jgi:hypothetical protein
VLHLWSPTTGGGDPDDDDNSDSNGAPSPLGGVAAKAITLTSSGEPTDDGDGNEYTNLSLDFGFWPNPGSIGGLAWQDSDGDGLQDSGEARLGGITVTLYSTSNVPLATATTGSDGHYRFGDLPAGEYYEVFTPPGNRRLTVANSGSDDAADSDAENGGRTATIPLTNGWDAVHWDVGLLAPTGEEERPEPGLTQSLYLPAIQR